MFQDEAGFGRINKPKSCWCRKGERPSVPCHHIREYRYAYGAVEPKNGESFFLVLPYCNTDCMNVFLGELAKAYPDDQILLVCDGAMWHKANDLKVPRRISAAIYTTLFADAYGPAAALSTILTVSTILALVIFNKISGGKNVI